MMNSILSLKNIFNLKILNTVKCTLCTSAVDKPTISDFGKNKKEISGTPKAAVTVDEPEWEDNPFSAFFDEKGNWGKDVVITGRSWRLDELRIKKNADLHKLWFVLLKERNVLKTMERCAEKYYVAMPCPERLYKIEESMENLEQVVAERNNAFIQLETGETGERPTKKFTTILGFRDKKYLTEHSKPAETKENVYEVPYADDDVYMFQKLWKEKVWEEKRNVEDDEKRNQGKHKRWHRN